jgi:hypothetical protein
MIVSFEGRVALPSAVNIQETGTFFKGFGYKVFSGRKRLQAM